MYGLPKDFDTNFLQGKTLELVCFSENTVNFHFDGGLHITVESAYAHRVPESRETEEIKEIPVSSSDIMQLVGCSIAQVSANVDGTLSLTFENDHRLLFFDTSRQYESYKIDYNEKTIIV